VSDDLISTDFDRPEKIKKVVTIGDILYQDDNITIYNYKSLFKD
jgi:hypothetical protein